MRNKKPSNYILSEEHKKLAINMAIEGQTIQKIADTLCIDAYHFWKSRQDDPDFSNKFAQARQEGIHLAVDKLDTVHEAHPDPQVARIVSDNIKWKASKLNPGTYGDRLDVNVNHTVDLGGALADAKNRALASTARTMIDVTPESEEDDDIFK